MDRERQKPVGGGEGRYGTLAAVGVSLAILLVVVGGYYLEWEWAGVAERTFWDWLDLLLVPAALAVGGYLFTRSENRRAQEIANQRAEDDREIADQRRQDDLLQAYLDQMGALLLDKERPLRAAEQGSEARILARARTLTVLGSLDGNRKATLLQFLYGAGLIKTAKDAEREIELQIALVAGAYPIEEDEEAIDAEPSQPAVVSLSGADLHNINLSDALLTGVDLSGANLRGADLKDIDLVGALLNRADLRGADMSNATLIGTKLDGAVLLGANLRGADLRRAGLHKSDLRGADLGDTLCWDADLTFASLNDADLSSAHLFDADLSYAEGLTETQLQQARSLEGATGTDGSKQS